MVGRSARRVAAVLVGPFLPWLAWLGACSAGSVPSAFVDDASIVGTSTLPGDAGPIGEDATAIIFGDDANGGNPDAAVSALCPGVAVPEDATTTACAIDMSAFCPPCASWGFVCAGWASPRMQGASAAAFCRATEIEGGALVCCTQPACVVSTVAGQCDASSQTRYDCSGGAVPRGTCEWLGAASPNDYCCQ